VNTINYKEYLTYVLRQGRLEIILIRKRWHFGLVTGHAITNVRHKSVWIAGGLFYPLIVCLSLSHVRSPVKEMKFVDNFASLVIAVFVSQKTQNQARVALSCKLRDEHKQEYIQMLKQ